MNLLAKLVLSVAALAATGVGAQTLTTLVKNGPKSSKINLVIIGDGFRAGADQTAYNNFVRDVVIRDMFDETRDGAYREIMGAFNIYRVNAPSAESGITTVDANGDVVTAVDTFFQYRFSGDWDRCWMEPGPESNDIIDDTLDELVPGWDYAFLVLNTTAFGGCRRGSQLAITMGGTWTVAAHEMGHLVGNLGDEYQGAADYTGSEPNRVNLTRKTKRSSIKWRQFIDPGTALPTTARPPGWDNVQDAGLFEGATYRGTQYDTGIFRPSQTSRMVSNAPEFNSVGFDRMRRVAGHHQDYRYRNVHAGAFTGRAAKDLVLHQENSLYLYAGGSSTFAPTWVRTMPDPVWDAYRPGDRFLVGDFDGDGRQDLFVFNFADWSMPYFAMLRSTGAGFEGIRRFDDVLPGWGQMKPHDQFFVADVDGDARDDILVFNGEDWSMGYLLILRSTGTDLAYVHRYDNTLPGWGEMRRRDRFYVADFDGDGRSDLYIDNQRDWDVGYLAMLRSNGSTFSFVKRYDQELPGWDDMKNGDRFHVGDFDADGRQDLYVFNGADWSMPYLEMLRSTGKELRNTRRFDRNVPGWGEMRRHDEWYVADVNGDKRFDLYVYNADDWATQYLGTLRSSGTSLYGGFQSNKVGLWNLRARDRFLVTNFNGGAGWDDLLVYNDDWLGLLRSQSSRVTLTSIHPKWIHNYEYHDEGWW